jgi:hypothetical protein
MRIIVIIAAALAFLVAAAPANAAAARPTTYIVSRTPADNPEGISVSADGTMYVSSVGSGAVFAGTDREPELHPFVPAGADGRHAAAGVHVDRFGRIFVAGFDTGALYVYDRAGRLLAKRDTVAGAKLNDFTFTDDAVYVTDSGTGTVWRASLTGAAIGPLRAWLTADEFTPSAGFLNGIVTTPGQGALIVSDQLTDTTFHVDISTRHVVPLTVVGAPNGLFSADGLLLEGRHLYGVHNFYDPTQPGGIAIVTRLMQMSSDYLIATWIADSDKASAAETPTTIARDGCRLLWVNSQLFTAPGTPPYTVTQVPGLL